MTRRKNSKTHALRQIARRLRNIAEVLTNVSSELAHHDMYACERIGSNAYAMLSTSVHLDRVADQSKLLTGRPAADHMPTVTVISTVMEPIFCTSLRRKWCGRRVINSQQYNSP